MIPRSWPAQEVSQKEQKINRAKKALTERCEIPRSTFILKTGIPFIVIISYSFLALQADLRFSIPVLVGVTGVVIALLATILYLSEKGIVNWSPGTILVIAAVLRLLFVFRVPELSDDIYRYIWDGHQLLSGHNPYAAAPADVKPVGEETGPLPRRLFEKINHPDLVTIYPPAAQIVFSAGVSLGKGLYGIKALLAALDILTCVMILRMLKILGQPPSRAVLYAWHPLPVLEIAASSHIDGAGILFFILTLSLLVSQEVKRHESLTAIFSTSLAGMAFSAAVLVKLFPLVYLPGCLILCYRRTIFLAGLLAGAFFLSIPFWPGLLNALGTLNVYATSWEFSGFAFRTLRRITSSGMVSREILALCLLMFIVWVTIKLRTRIGTFGSGEERTLSTLQYFYSISLAFLMITPVLHPWYALYLAWLLPFSAGPSGLVLSFAVFLSYRVLIPYTLLGQWVENDIVPLMIWAAPIVAFLLASWFNRKGNIKRTML